MPLVTVGIPVYNAMPHLPESLESILGQSFADFEILVINDGSTDGSSEYLQSVRDRRLRVVEQENQGLTATLNRMLAESNTPWHARHDADDVAYPHRMARTIEYIQKYPDAGMFYSLADYYPHGSVGQFRTTKGSPSDILQLVRSGRLPAICHPTVTLNVDKTVSAGGYRFNLHVEDIDLWWRLALLADVRLVPEVTMGVRQNHKSVSSANLESQAINTLYIQYLLLSHLWNHTPLPYEQARVVLRSLFNPEKLDFKAHIRSFNIALGQRKHSTALWELGRASFASPIDIFRRVLDELVKDRMIAQGELPQGFSRLANVLWPSPLTPADSAADPRNGCYENS